MFDIIIPTYNNLEELKLCLRGFEIQTCKEFKIFICVDGSTDGTLEYLRDNKLNFETGILLHPDNLNKGRNRARNLALPYLSAKFVLLIDSDIIPDQKLLENHLNILKKEDSISVGDIEYKNREKNLWADYLQTRGKNKYNHLDKILPYYLNTQNTAMKTEYYTGVGGQDIEMSDFYGGDDTELGYNIYKKYKVPFVFNKQAVGVSILNKNLDYALAQMKEFGSVNLKKIREKHPEQKDIFRLYLMVGNGFRSRLARFFSKKYFTRLIRRILPIFPRFVKLHIINYLVFANIFQGFAGNDK